MTGHKYNIYSRVKLAKGRKKKKLRKRAPIKIDRKNGKSGSRKHFKT
jgi:hypothetical protein